MEMPTCVDTYLRCFCVCVNVCYVLPRLSSCLQASTYAASDLTLRSRGSIRGDSRPASAMAQPTAADDYDNDVEDTSESLTPFQQMFGSAWKQGQAKVS